LSKCGATKL